MNEPATQSVPVSLTVHDPSGAFKVTPLFAPRLDNLAGKTICELWNGAWEGQATFTVINELLQKQYHTLKIIPYTEFPVGKPDIDNDKTAELVRATGCDAVIVGNAA